MTSQKFIGLKPVAAQCGFGDTDTFRRAFVRQVGVTPASYQKHFG